MSSRWYYQLMIEEFGPVNAEQLRELLECGTLSDGDLVRQESSEIWIPISDVRESLFADDDSRSFNEEIGDLSELAFEFEDSGPTTRRGAYAEDVDADISPSIETSTPVAPTSSSATSSSATSSRPVSSPPATPPPESRQQAREEHKEEWFCESLGQVMGPMSFEELIELGKGGALDANDRVKCGERGLWKIVEQLPSVMRAVALSRAIEVDPQMVSSTTQKRLGDAAYAAMVDSPEVPELTPVPQQQLQPPTPTAASPTVAAAVAADQPQQNEAASATDSTKTSTKTGKTNATKPRPKRRKSAKGEDALLDEIFDDVFNDDNAPILPKTPMHSMAAASTAASAAVPGNPPSPNQALQNSAAAAAYGASPSSSTMSSGSNSAGLAAAAMAARPISTSKSSGRSFDFDPKVIGMFVAILLVGAGGYYVWQSGMLSGSMNGNGSFDRTGAVKALEAAMARYKAVGSSPSEDAWKQFSVKTKLEMSALFKSVYERAGATPQGAACLAAITSLMKIASTTPDNTEAIEKHIAEFERQIPLVTK